jgi:protein TonB
MPVVLAAVALMLLPCLATAQETIYQASDLTEQPKIKDAQQARTVIMRSYNTHLQNAGFQGRVELTFVVKADGTVDPESVEILRSPADALSSAAKAAVARIQFQPGKKDGTAVACRVAMPISYGQDR